jgi:hypothetical protein
VFRARIVYVERDAGDRPGRRHDRFVILARRAEEQSSEAEREHGGAAMYGERVGHATAGAGTGDEAIEHGNDAPRQQKHAERGAHAKAHQRRDRQPDGQIASGLDTQPMCVDVEKR